MTSIQETKYEHPVRIKLEQVSTFLPKHFGAKVEQIEPVGKGLWSQAFFFRRTDTDYVLRFGDDGESYDKDSESREKTGTCSQFSEAHPIYNYVKNTNKPGAKANLFAFCRSEQGKDSG